MLTPISWGQGLAYVSFFAAWGRHVDDNVVFGAWFVVFGVDECLVEVQEEGFEFWWVRVLCLT